jgi:hypothetical protein
MGISIRPTPNPDQVTSGGSALHGEHGFWGGGSAETYTEANLEKRLQVEQTLFRQFFSKLDVGSPHFCFQK